MFEVIHRDYDNLTTLQAVADQLTAWRSEVEDWTYLNDACPSLGLELKDRSGEVVRVKLYVDWKNPEWRDLPELQQFSVVPSADRSDLPDLQHRGQCLLDMGMEFDAAADAVAEFQRLVEYVEGNALWSGKGGS